jgi:hypothetical protein
MAGVLRDYAEIGQPVIIGGRSHARRLPRLGELLGEAIDPGRQELEADVKGVTRHGLRVERSGEGWSAQVTLDV